MEQILEQLIRITGHTEEDFEILAASAVPTESWTDGLVKEFYDILFSYEPTRAVFEENERSEREETLRSWLLEVTSGKVSDGFWHHQWTVGLVHIKRHVSNTFMLGMMNRLQASFLAHCLKQLGENDGLPVYLAFQRITDIVAGLIAEGFHQGYAEAVADVTGMRGGLLDRMADVAIDGLLERARASS